MLCVGTLCFGQGYNCSSILRKYKIDLDIKSVNGWKRSIHHGTYINFVEGGQDKNNQIKKCILKGLDKLSDCNTITIGEYYE